MSGMHSESVGPAIPPERADLFRYRTYFLSLENMEAAWVRTAVSLISFGFTISKIFQSLRESKGQGATLFSPGAVGIIMIAIGLGGLVAATLEHRRALRELRKECPGLPPSVAGGTAIVLIMLGIVALLGAIFRLTRPAPCQDRGGAIT